MGYTTVAGFPAVLLNKVLCHSTDAWRPTPDGKLTIDSLLHLGLHGDIFTEYDYLVFMQKTMIT